jgi:hypothetical protein
MMAVHLAWFPLCRPYTRVAGYFAFRDGAHYNAPPESYVSYLFRADFVFGKVNHEMEKPRARSGAGVEIADGFAPDFLSRIKILILAVDRQ